MSNTILKPFDRVLVRDSEKEKWRISLFERYDSNRDFPYYCLDIGYKQCILYEGNEDLLNTTNSPKSKYEFKQGDPVIVWDDESDVQYIRVFSYKLDNGYYTYNREGKTTTRWDNCIPFKP